jgi:hypothetical protein
VWADITLGYVNLRDVVAGLGSTLKVFPLPL